MTLSEYLARSGLSQSELALQLDVAPSTVSRYLRGEIAPTLEQMGRIQKATNGAVQPNDWLPQ